VAKQIARDRSAVESENRQPGRYAYAGLDRETSRHSGAPDPIADVPPAVIAESTMMAPALPIRMNVHNRNVIRSSRKFLETIAYTLGRQSDLPLNFHPAAIRASTDVTPFGAVSVPA
jgi:hypothetical protein